MSARKASKAGTILSARGIVNRFGNQTVHDHISLDVIQGEIIGIVGGSGSGKSVLLKTLTGLRQPTAGEVTLEGQRIEDIGPSEKAALIGVLFQQGALFSSLSVAQNVMLPMREHTDLPTEEHLAHAVAALAHVVAANEGTVADRLFTDLLPHAERVERFAAAAGRYADGKLR